MNNSIDPNHYKGADGKETRFIIEEISEHMGGSIDAYEGFCIGNVLKYLTRYPDKGGLEDLMKAKRYIEFLIEHYQHANEVVWE